MSEVSSDSAARAPERRPAPATAASDHASDENSSVLSFLQTLPLPHSVSSPINTLTLLNGELEMICQPRATLVASSNSSHDSNRVGAHGCFLLTNYRIIFYDTRTLTHIELPLGCIESCTRDELTIAFASKDHRVLMFLFDHAASSWVQGLLSFITSMAFPGNQTRTFAFSHKLLVDHSLDGWNFYDPMAEFTRMGITKTDKTFRVSYANIDYELSPTYPRYIVTPKCITDDELHIIAKYRSARRFPAVVFRHPRTGATLARCSQPMSGVRGKRCAEDEKLINAFREANPTNNKVIYLMDCRPYAAALGNAVMGKGVESTDHYKNSQLHFLNIDNIHVIRASYVKLIDLLSTPEPGPTASDEANFAMKLQQTQWLHYIRAVLAAAVKLVRAISEEGASCVAHCSDGWDRTSQLCSLVLLMSDPYYRTKKGFAILVEQEWLSFGHQFATRCGHTNANNTDEQRSPIFLQWLDCVWQIYRQFPMSFEFNEEYLMVIVDNIFSCRFGTFLFNNESERRSKSVHMKTVSMWTVLCHPANDALYSNGLYRVWQGPREILPSTSVTKIVLWERNYFRYDNDRQVKQSEALQVRVLNHRYLALRQKIIAAGLDINALDPVLDRDNDAIAIHMNAQLLNTHTVSFPLDSPAATAAGNSDTTHSNSTTPLPSAISSSTTSSTAPALNNRNSSSTPRAKPPPIPVQVAPAPEAEADKPSNSVELSITAPPVPSSNESSTPATTRVSMSHPPPPPKFYTVGPSPSSKPQPPPVPVLSPTASPAPASSPSDTATTLNSPSRSLTPDLPATANLKYGTAGPPARSPPPIPASAIASPRASSAADATACSVRELMKKFAQK